MLTHYHRYKTLLNDQYSIIPSDNTPPANMSDAYKAYEEEKRLEAEEKMKKAGGPTDLVCTYIPMYVCGYMYVRLWVRRSGTVPMYDIRVCVCLWVYVCLRVTAYVCMYVCMYVSISI